MNMSRLRTGLLLRVALSATSTLNMASSALASQEQNQERTIFQTGQPYAPSIDIRGDVAVVYGIDSTMQDRVSSWRDQGYRVHLMTGVSWGEYQDYLYGRWDGKNHTDEAQTMADGSKISHGRDVYYMSPGPDYGRYLSEGVLRACDAGVEAVHLEEPEFWAKGGHSPAFKREWSDMYGEAWQAPESSVDARWRANRLMYFLYRRALQQIFDAVQQWNARPGAPRHVRCYVPTHSLLNYAAWRIVSPESSLALLNGSDGYIAQVWTGTSREPNIYGGVRRERTFETALLEYGIMQNLVRATGRGIWYLADPVEDNADHTWVDYRDNYHATLVASLLQPDVAQYEITPWPERVFGYPGKDVERPGHEPIPPAYAQELQQVFNALKDMRQPDTKRLGAVAPAIGLAMSDSLMFQRGGPGESDSNMSHIYGLAMPFVKRGVPIQPVQLENFPLQGYLDNLTVILMSYEGQKPLTPEVHAPILSWVKNGGTLVFVDDDADPFHKAREWWNTGNMSFATPREHLFESLGLRNVTGSSNDTAMSSVAISQSVGKGSVTFLRRSPTSLAFSTTGSQELYDGVLAATQGMTWRPAAYHGLRRGPYIVLAGLDETDAPAETVKGQFVDLFDPDLAVLQDVAVAPASRHFLIDLQAFNSSDVVACAGQVGNVTSDAAGWSGTVEGAEGTRGILLLRLPTKASSATVDDQAAQLQVQAGPGDLFLTWIKFQNAARPRQVEVRYGKSLAVNERDREDMGFVIVNREDTLEDSTPHFSG